MFRRFRLPLAAVAMTLMLTSCIVVTFQPHNLISDPAPATYPVGYTYDWVWIALHPDVVTHINDTAGEFVIQGRVCFPDTTFPRQFLATYIQGEPIYRWTTGADCTYWAPLANFGDSQGWRKMAAVGAGETIYIQLLVTDNHSNEAFQAPVSARVATADQTTIWYDF
jgi:hypothetical protein